MHAKAAVADSRVAFLTSANLTEAALERNMELGVLSVEATYPPRSTALLTRSSNRVNYKPSRPAKRDYSPVKFVWHLPAGRAPAPGQQSRVPSASQAGSAGSPARRQSATAGPPSG